MKPESPKPIFALISLIGPIASVGFIFSVINGELGSVQFIGDYALAAAISGLLGGILAVVSLAKEEKPMAVATISFILSFISGGFGLVVELMFVRQRLL